MGEGFWEEGCGYESLNGDWVIVAPAAHHVGARISHRVCLKAPVAFVMLDCVALEVGMDKGKDSGEESGSRQASGF